jgi:hypothetical protein
VAENKSKNRRPKDGKENEGSGLVVAWRGLSLCPDKGSASEPTCPVRIL